MGQIREYPHECREIELRFRNTGTATFDSGQLDREILFALFRVGIK